MNKTLRTILAIIAGFLVGSTVNMALVGAGHSMYPIEGIDPNSMEDLAKVMPTLRGEYFIFPFLAHALGTLVGALMAALIAKGNRMRAAWVIGIVFLVGGITACFMIPAPMWFIALDLIVAYLPMAYLGGILAKKFSKEVKIEDVS